MNIYSSGTLNSNNFNMVKNFGHAKDKLMNQLLDHFRSFQKKFDVSFDLNIEENSFGFVINNEYTFEFIMYESKNNYNFKLDGPNKITFHNVTDFPFRINESERSFFVFNFDNDFNVSSIDYGSHLDFNRMVKLSFDSSLELFSVKIKYLSDKIDINKNKQLLMSFKDEALLFSLLAGPKDYVEEVFPEFLHHGAHYFSDDDFKSRLEIWKIMEF